MVVTLLNPAVAGQSTVIPGHRALTGSGATMDELRSYPTALAVASTSMPPTFWWLKQDPQVHLGVVTLQRSLNKLER